MTTFLDRLLAPLGYAKAQPRPPSQLLALAHSQRWDMPEASDAEKQAKLYVALTWIATAVDRVAQLAAQAEFSVAKQTGGPDSDDEDLPNHEFELLLRRPNPMQSRGEFMRDAVSWYNVTGNNYIFLNRANENAKPDEMWHIPSHMIQPVPDGRSYIRGYAFTPPGHAEPIPLRTWEVMHWKTYNPFNPFVGLSALMSLALDSYGDIAQQKWNLSLFDKNNGKMPGILAFKHQISDPEWKKMVAQRDNEWGGTQRAGVMMLRGVGDSVQWLPAAMSQSEMEFLEGRTFTKEEIYGKLAPGLSSILAVNATEANAKVGERILINHGVWPLLVQLAEKIESDLLPVYGDDLVGAFDDIRPVDTAEEEKFFTINEIRKRRYNAEPLYLDKSQEERLNEEAKVGEENKELALQARAEAPAVPSKKPPQFGKADTSAKPSKTLDPRGFLFAAQIGPATPLPGDTTKPPAPAMPPPPPVMQAEGDAVPDKEAVSDGQAEELAKWEKFAVARVGKAGAREFEPRVVDVFTAGRIRAALKAATTQDDVRAVFARERGGESDMARLAAALEKAAAKL